MLQLQHSQVELVNFHPDDESFTANVNFSGVILLSMTHNCITNQITFSDPDPNFINNAFQSERAYNCVHFYAMCAHDFASLIADAFE